MIIVQIIGGLGNQMFQYACGYALSKKKNDILKLDTIYFKHISNFRTYGLRFFNITAPLASRKEIIKLRYEKESIFKKIKRKIFKKQVKFSQHYYQDKEPYAEFDPTLYTISKDIYLSGYWQNEKYFLTYHNDILEQFTLKNKIHEKNSEYKNLIKKTQSISLHVRRTDYISYKLHCLCNLDYYKKAIAIIQSKIVKPHYFIFSDDLKWTKKHFSFLRRSTFVESDKNAPDNEEIYLMSICQHNIIANSSFSWWGAWLNQSPQKIVIAPKKWINSDTQYNIVPKSWVCL